MREAVRMWEERRRLAPRGHPQHLASMFDLGVALLHSGIMFGDLGDLSSATAVLESVKKRLDPSVDRAAVLSALGNARLSRYLSVTRGKQAELDAALEEHRQAMAAAEPQGPNALTIMSDFGAALMRGYEETRDGTLLEASIAALRRASSATPPGHARKPERLNQLVSALLALHERAGDPGTLDEAISISRIAVAATDPAHAIRASSLYGLASGLFRRGELRRTLLDFDEAAIRATEAVEASPDDLANLALRLALQAAALCYLPSVTKLEQADQNLTAAEGRLRRDDPERTRLQSNHGVLLDALARFIDDGGPEAQRYAVRAVDLTRRAVDATSPDHSEYLGRLVNFVAASATLARLNRDPSVLDDALRRCDVLDGQAETGLPATLLEPARAYAMAVRHELTGDAGAAAAAIEAYHRGASDPRLAVYRRLDAVHAGADLAVRCGETRCALELYTLAIDLLDSAAWRGIERRDQERLLAQYASLASDAAATAITASWPQIAVEFLERGRGILLDRLMDDSADLTLLSQVDTDLARQFEDLRRDLEEIVIPDLEADDFDVPLRPAEQESEADQRSALALQLDRLISQIRAKPGYEDLFRSPSFPALHAAVGSRSVALINISANRCDALVITPGGLTITPLPDLTKSDTERAAEFFRTRAEEASQPGHAGQAGRNELTARLEWLWDTVAEPVLHDMGITDAAGEDVDVPRLYWCPTGPAAFLPLHAAGHHGTASSSAPAAVIDRAESVYIAKLRMLASDQPGRSVSQGTSQPPLIVSMPTTPGRRPLPRALDEAGNLMGIFPGAEYLSGPAATRDAVQAGLGSHCWFHFAVHGTTDDHTPVDGGLELADGRLTIRHLAQRRLPDARFAYLSACLTYQGSSAIPDEAVTVGTALCITGCANVMAALWPVSDEHTADFSHQVYDHLLTASGGTPALHPENTAHALRQTARAIRDAQPENPERWAAFVCATTH